MLRLTQSIHAKHALILSIVILIPRFYVEILTTMYDISIYDISIF